jgi:hypothetical protein
MELFNQLHAAIFPVAEVNLIMPTKAPEVIAQPPISQENVMEVAKVQDSDVQMASAVTVVSN